MTEQTYSDIVTPELLAGAIENNEYEGFREDYHVLHCLIRKYQPLTFMEIGQNMGTGTQIICNAGKNWLIKVYSLDLPDELCHISLQHPKSEGKGGSKVGSNCTFAHTQLKGDSLTFDFSKYPCEGAFIDSEHDFEHPYKEACEVFKWKPKIVIWHDANVKSVSDSIWTLWTDYKVEYDFHRVTDTRIAYAIRK